MILKNIFHLTIILTIFGAIVTRITCSTLSMDLEKRRASSHRPSWSTWFHNREESSFNRNESDDYKFIHGRHEFQSSRPFARILHENSLRNLRSRYDIETTERGRKLNDDDESKGEENESRTSLGRDRIQRNSTYPSVTKDSGNEFIESRSSRPMSTRKINDTRSGYGYDTFEGSDKSEKLTAVALAKYSNIRAVLYPGYRNTNFHYNHTITRDNILPDYEIVATPETPIYTKHHAGRRVCTRQTPNSIAHHHRSRQYRLLYTELTSSTFLCCPGWSQVSRTSYGCNRPTCAAICLNGGVCGTHGKCNCPKGYTGTQCQTDIDECMTEKPCGQICTNVPGSYECYCRYGFHLQPDGQSCRKNGSDGTAFEARDLENDYGYTTSTTTETPRRTTPASRDTENEVGEGNLDQNYEIILKRLAKLEKQIARGRKKETEVLEISTKITQAVEGVAAMRRAFDNIQLMQQEIYDMRGKVKQFELENRKLQHLINRVNDLENRLKLRCRTLING